MRPGYLTSAYSTMISEGFASGTSRLRLVFFLFFLWVLAAALPSHGAGAAREETGAPAARHAKAFPFDRGESVVYRGSWIGIPVASAEIQTTPLLINGRKYYHARVRASTWKYLELIWKMRDFVESVFDSETMQPRRFVFRQRENRKKTDTTATFDPDSKKWTVRRREGAKVKDFEFVSHSTLDPISAVYWARSLDFKIGDTLRLEVFGGKSRYLVMLDVVGKEQVTVGDNSFDAYRIVPHVWNISGSGYADRVREATVWISADKGRRPLKIVTQVFIGSVSIELVEEKSLGAREVKDGGQMGRAEKGTRG